MIIDFFSDLVSKYLGRQATGRWECGSCGKRADCFWERKNEESNKKWESDKEKVIEIKRNRK